MSRLIKSQFTNTEIERKKIISLKPLFNSEYVSQEVEDPEISDDIDVDKVKEEAELILNSAKQEAERIIEEANLRLAETRQQLAVERENWQTEKEGWIDSAKQQGYEEGYQKGIQDATQEYKGLIKEARNVVQSAKQDYDKHLMDSEATIMELGIKSAEKILDHNLKVDPESILSIVQRVMKEVKDFDDIQIYVHPSHYDFVLAHKVELEASLNQIDSKLYIYPNEELQRQDCIIESSFGRIDASIDIQLNEIRTKLLEHLEGDDE